MMQTATQAHFRILGYAVTDDDGAEHIYCCDHTPLAKRETDADVWAIRDEDMAAEPDGTFVCEVCRFELDPNS